MKCIEIMTIYTYKNKVQGDHENQMFTIYVAWSSIYYYIICLGVKQRSSTYIIICILHQSHLCCVLLICNCIRLLFHIFSQTLFNYYIILILLYSTTFGALLNRMHRFKSHLKNHIWLVTCIFYILNSSPFIILKC